MGGCIAWMMDGWMGGWGQNNKNGINLDPIKIF